MVTGFFDSLRLSEGESLVFLTFDKSPPIHYNK